MSIKHFAEKIKGVGDFQGFRRPNLPVVPDDVFFGLVLILVAFGSFGLGRLSRFEGAKVPIRVENEPQATFNASLETTATPATVTQSAAVLGATESASGTRLVGSKTGKKYHYPWCAGAQKIAEANRVYFSSKADAEAAGYTPASNCKGL